MPLEARHRIEFAPQVHDLLSFATARCSATSRSRQAVCDALERFCAVEQSIEGSRSVPPETSPCWSALGDVCVNGGEHESIPDTAWSRPQAGARTFAPVVGRTVVDGHSPFVAEVFREEPVKPPSIRRVPRSGGPRLFGVRVHRVGGLGAFTQACFVWFGLWNFWEQAGPPNEEGRRLAERARKGFEAGPLLDHVPAEGLAILEPEVIDAIRSVAAEVRAAARTC